MRTSLLPLLVGLAVLASGSMLVAPLAGAQSTVDTDLDGRPDDAEGDGDIDGDGIPNIEDAHDFWVSGQVVDGVNGSVVWLIGSGEDTQIDTPDDVVVGKVDGPNFRFQNVNDGAYVVVAGVDPATENVALRTMASVEGAPVEGVTVGSATAATDSGRAAEEAQEVSDPAPASDLIVDPLVVDDVPAALALDEAGTNSDPVLVILVSAAAFLFGVLLAYQFSNWPRPQHATKR